MLFKTYEEGGYRLYICATSESDRDQVCKYMESQGKNYYKPLSFPTLFYTIVSGDREENQIREFLNKQFSDFGLIIDTQCNKVSGEQLLSALHRHGWILVRKCETSLVPEVKEQVMKLKWELYQHGDNFLEMQVWRVTSAMATLLNLIEYHDLKLINPATKEIANDLVNQVV